MEILNETNTAVKRFILHLRFYLSIKELWSTFMLSFLSSLPVSVKRILDLEANKFYDMGRQRYESVAVFHLSIPKSIKKYTRLLVISTSLISNHRKSRSKNLFPVLPQRSINRQQNIVENCS